MEIDMSKTKKIKVKLVKSIYGLKPGIEKTVKALGLFRLNQEVEHDDNPVIQGMIFKVKHLVSVN